MHAMEATHTGKYLGLQRLFGAGDGVLQGAPPAALLAVRGARGVLLHGGGLRGVMPREPLLLRPVIASRAQPNLFVLEQSMRKKAFKECTAGLPM